MFVQVAPIVKMPRTAGLFDFAVPAAFRNKIGRGSLVIVPWRNRATPALVFGLAETSAVPAGKLKEITAVPEIPPLPEDFIRALEWISEKDCVSPATAAAAFVPSFPRRKPPMQAAASASDGPASAESSIRIVRYVSPRQKFAETADIAASCVAAKRACLVIVPHSEDVTVTVEALAALRPDVPFSPYHGELRPKELRETWLRLLSGEPTVVVGTRLASMAPVPRLGAIVIHESDSPDLKQYDQNPRYDCREIARIRSRNTCNLVIMSHGPRVEEYAAASEALTTDPEVDEAVTFVDISGRNSPDQPLAPASLHAIETALQSQKKVLIFHNRQGTATALVCGDCRRVFRCRYCEVALRVHGEKLQCPRCSAPSASIPAACPDCGSARLLHVGKGAAGLETWLHQQFAGVSIARIDATARQLPRRADILIGTQTLLHAFAEQYPAEEIAAVIATSVDDLLSHPGFRTGEDAWRTVRVLRDIAAVSGAELLLQCLDPAHPKIKRLVAGYREFMAAELAERTAAGYPPKGVMLALLAFGASEAEAKRAAQQVRDRAEQARAGMGKLDISGPLRPETPFRHGSWRYAVIIKTPTITPELDRFLRNLPEGCVIDRNPERII